MFSSGRFYNDDGIKFYEQDIIIDDHVYNSDIEINMNLDYINSGFGIVLLNEDDFLREKNELYVFRIGYKEYSIEYKLENMQRTVLRNPINVAPPKKDMAFNFNKNGRKIKISSGIASFEYIMPRNFSKFKIGIYSNSDNIVKTFSALTQIPNDWIVNMKNTDGGYITFEDNKIIIEQCKNNAEIMQNSIKIKPGKYKLNYIIENKESDIKPYIYYENDNRYKDDEKNILDFNNEFYISQECYICLKFKGKNGTIKNIYITDNKEDSYVPTKANEQIVNGSYLSINTFGLKYIQWEGIINSIPNKSYSIADDGIQQINAFDLGIFIDVKYTYKYDIENNKLFIYKNNEIIKTSIINSGCQKFKIFYNIDAIITDLFLVKKNGQKTNVLLSQTKKKVIPGSIISPITVADYSDMPFDLSSSYRVIKKDNKEKYIFTNIEREFFKPAAHIKLSNKISNKIGGLKIYGILDNPKINMKNMLTIPDENMDIINMFSEKYDIIYESNLKSLNKKTGDIFLYDYDKYNLIVVDYLKDDSYCINYDYDLNSYILDISTSKKNYYILYDYLDKDNKKVSFMNKYKNTGIIPIESNYIVLRRDDLI